jgi:hypothetical protein
MPKHHQEYPEDLLSVARRVVWFKEPAETLANTLHFFTYFMQYGTADDYVVLMRHYPPEVFRHAVENALPGVMDRRSWNFWCVRYFGTNTLPMPQRVLA